jgi:tetrathionate reductase subunit B
MAISQPTMIIDVTKCVSCFNCQFACKNEFVENDWLPYSMSQPETGHFWMRVQETVRGTVPKVRVDYIAYPCMQCQNPPCVKAAKNDAVYMRPDGITIIDPVKSKGQKDIVASCPYGAIYWNENLGIPQKCTFCAHLLDKGYEMPRCVEACQGYAMTFGDYKDLEATIKAKGAVTLSPQFGAQPRVYYIGYPTGLFIAGALVNSSGECAEGVDVSIKDTGTGQVVASAKSDNFGDFWFNELPADKAYEVAMSVAGKTKTISVTLNKDTNLGDIQL